MAGEADTTLNDKLRERQKKLEESEYGKMQKEDAAKAMAQMERDLEESPKIAAKNKSIVDKVTANRLYKEKMEKRRGKGYVSDRTCKTILKAVEGYKGYDKLEDLVRMLAAAEGVEDVETVVKDVLAKLKGTEATQKGQKLGVAHDPVKQANSLAATIASMRY